jgi:hypothetical protein
MTPWVGSFLCIFDDYYFYYCWLFFHTTSAKAMEEYRQYITKKLRNLHRKATGLIVLCRPRLSKTPTTLLVSPTPL